MAKKREDFSEEIEIGRKNLRLWPQLINWCKHIEIEMVSGGLLAQETGLPIGFLQVKCPHGLTRSQSMHLDREARSFVLNNCIGCQFHTEIAPDNLGRQIIKEKEASDEAAAELAIRREYLARETYSTAEKSLESKEITMESVNQLILNEFKEGGPAEEDTRLLREAAVLGPEFFSDNAIQVLLEGSGSEHGLTCLQVLRHIFSYRHDKLNQPIPSTAAEVCLKVLHDESEISLKDAACDLLADYLEETSNSPLILDSLDAIIGTPDYRFFRWRMPSSMFHKRPQHAGTQRLLQKMWELEPKSVQAAYDSRLRINSNDTRLSAAETLIDLLPNRAESLFLLVPTLLRSLELADDRYENSADGAVCRLLGHLYAFAPDRVEQQIIQFLPSASTEARLLVLDIYLTLARKKEPSRWPEAEGFKGFPSEDYSRHAGSVIDKLYQVATDLAIDPSTRLDVWRKLENIIEMYPELASQKLDQLLGRLSMTLREVDQAREEFAQSQLPFYEVFGQRSTYDALARAVHSALKKAVEGAPEESFPKVQSFLDQLDSTKDGQLKAWLVLLLGDIAKRSYELVPSVIFQLYKHLVDFQSPYVRSRAIMVLEKLIHDWPDQVPDNMIALLVTYLSEDLKIIHKSAMKALGEYEFPDSEEANQALRMLLGWMETYLDMPNEEDFLKDLLNTLFWAFPNKPALARHIVEWFMPRLLRYGSEYFREDMLERFSWTVEKHPELAGPYVEAAVSYLGNSQRETLNDYTTSTRHEIFQLLFDVPTALISPNIEVIKSSFQDKIVDDFSDAMHLLELISHHGLHDSAAELAEEAIAKLPEGKRYEFARRGYRAASIAERINLAVISGAVGRAKELAQQTVTEVAGGDSAQA